jgi:hypothetical protein
MLTTQFRRELIKLFLLHKLISSDLLKSSRINMRTTAAPVQHMLSKSGLNLTKKNLQLKNNQVKTKICNRTPMQEKELHQKNDDASLELIDEIHSKAIKQQYAKKERIAFSDAGITCKNGMLPNVTYDLSPRICPGSLSVTTRNDLTKKSESDDQQNQTRSSTGPTKIPNRFGKDVDNDSDASSIDDSLL